MMWLLFGPVDYIFALVGLVLGAVGVLLLLAITIGRWLAGKGTEQ